jgi:hypothetical protein
MSLKDLVLGETLTCGNCLFWNDDRKMQREPWKHDGQCRKLPPTHDGYPLVQREWWCGEYKGNREISRKFDALHKKEVEQHAGIVAKKLQEVMLAQSVDEEEEAPN